VVALHFPGWAYKTGPKTVMIPGIYEIQMPDSNWSNLVYGGLTFTWVISSLFVCAKKISWKRLLSLMIAGGVWGCISYFAGIFAVICGFWSVLGTLYYLKRFPHQSLQLTTEPNNTLPLLDRVSLETIAAFVAGGIFSISLKYGSSSGMLAVTITLPLFLGAAMIFELLWYMGKPEKKTSVVTE